MAATDSQPATITRYAHWPSWLGRLVLFAALAVMGWGLFISGQVMQAVGPEAVPTVANRGGHDLVLYKRIVARVHGGQNYYEAAAIELPAGGYPTQSVFNWRLPTYAWLFGFLPQPRLGQGLLVVLALVAAVLPLRALAEEAGPLAAAGGGLLLATSMLWVLDGEAFYATELWAGVLIALSIGLVARRRHLGAVAAGLAALFLRELALPFVAVMLLAAAWQKRWPEALAWAAGLGLFCGFFLWHQGQVAGHMGPAQPGQVTSWVTLRGLKFLLDTSRMNYVVYTLPYWVSAVVLPLAVVGLGGFRSAWAGCAFWIVVSYLALFAVVGQWFNDYWGLLYAPLTVFGLAGAPAAWGDLLQTACGRNPEGKP